MIAPASDVERAREDCLEFAVLMARMDTATEAGIRAGLGELIDDLLMVAGLDDVPKEGNAT